MHFKLFAFHFIECCSKSTIGNKIYYVVVVSGTYVIFHSKFEKFYSKALLIKSWNKTYSLQTKNVQEKNCFSVFFFVDANFFQLTVSILRKWKLGCLLQIWQLFCYFLSIKTEENNRWNFQLLLVNLVLCIKWNLLPVKSRLVFLTSSFTVCEMSVSPTTTFAHCIEIK